MRNVLFAVMAVTLALAAAACKRGEHGGVSYDFRKARWGMTQEEVKASEETAPLEELPHVITYLGKLDGKEVIIGYVFDKGKFVRGGYLMNDVITDPDANIEAFEKMKKFLIDEYGQPAKQGSYWAEGVLPETDTAKFGEAVCAGRLTYAAMWANERTAINLKLEGEGGECVRGIVYESVDLFVIPSMVEDETEPSVTPGPAAE